MTSEKLRNGILAADLAWIPVALAIEQALCAGWHCGRALLGPFNFVVYVVCAVLGWILLSENLGLDGFRGGWRLPSLISRLLLAVGLLMMMLLALENTAEQYVGRVTLTVFGLLLLKGFLIIRAVALRQVFQRHQKGDLRRIVILGSDRMAAELAAKFKRHPEMLCEVVGFLWPGAEATALRSAAEPARGASTVSSMDVMGLLQQQKIDELVLAHPPASHEILDLVALCRERAIGVSLVPQPYELYLSRPSLLDLGGLPLLQLGAVVPRGATAGKRTLDFLLASLFSVAALPIVLPCAAILYLGTGKAFRWELRVGQQGKQFSMLRLNVDAAGHEAQTDGPFARRLRYFSFSELPQLWNVLRGEMSLVGPRPETPERAHAYSAWQQQRLAVKPGMTGLAQVHGLREQSSSEDKTRHDLQYMLNASLLRDISLLIETVWTLTLRLLDLRPRTLANRGGSGERQMLWCFPNQKPVAEILHHAHRTQPGSD
jgi:lipopolysaccharide/colanic/teichoic acid biosynthesis glycosyltransferase